MGKTPAKIISILFHPLLFPSIGILILFNSGTILEYLPLRAMKIIFLIVFVSTAILPLTFVPFFIFQKVIKNVHMESSKERLIPFFVTSVLYFFCYYLLVRLGAPETITKFAMAATASVGVLFILSFKWKISAHMVGIGGLVGALIAVSFRLNVNLEYFIIGAITVSGILGFSRLMLGAHKPYQIYIGWLTGLIIALLTVTYF